MIIFLLIGLVLIGTAVALVLRALVIPGVQAAERIGQIEAYGFRGVEPEHAPEPEEAGRLAKLLGKTVLARSKRISEPEVRAQLMKAGLYEMEPSTFVGYRAGAAFLAAGGFFVLGLAASTSLFLLVFGTAFSAVAGFTIPKTILERRIRLRHEEIDYTLPELIDLLVVTVEAGLGFSGSLQMASDRIKGPLGEEIRLTLQEQSMGLSNDEALAHMLARCDTPSMRSFVRSVLQAEQLGVSLGQIMRSLAVEMRMRRRQTAEERANKAPVKILFPLVFLIFPSMFVVILYPAVHDVLHSLSG
jgi:tight adherence protein C